MMSEEADTSTTTKNLVVDPFCFRQFAEHPEAGKGYTGTIFDDITIAEFEQIVNQRFDVEKELKDGYAPFCKHLFVTNDFTNAVVNVVQINADNEHLLRTKYEARNEKELPVLIRYFPKELLSKSKLNLPQAKYLDLILYSREQIQKENAAQGSGSSDDDAAAEQQAAPWGIVSIKAQDINTELPMNPITVMRNALGKEHGGSGVSLDKNEYMDAVQYWKDHAVVT